MDKDFLIYVICIGLIILLLAVIFVLVKIYKTQNISPPLQEKIEGGNVSVFLIPVIT